MEKYAFDNVTPDWKSFISSANACNGHNNKLTELKFMTSLPSDTIFLGLFNLIVLRRLYLGTEIPNLAL